MPDSYRKQLDVALSAARAAGGMLREEFHRPGGPRGYGGHADIDDIAEAAIFRILSKAHPEYGYRGEELGLKRTPADAEKHAWVVDPNDGTSDFLRGYRGSSVAIALLRDGRLVVGVVYAYCAPDSGGDLIWWAQGCGPVRRNGAVVERSWPVEAGDESTVLVSTWADLKIDVNARAMAPMRFRGTPSIAYRLGMIAVGDADATVSLNNPNSWDFGAGQALLIGAGANLLDGHGQVMGYTRDGFADAAGACFGGPDSLTFELMDRDWKQVVRGVRVKSSPFILPARGRAIEDPDLLSRAQGCVMGQFAGDALGAVVEGLDAEAIRAKYPDGLRRLVNGGVWGTIAGQPTDDSEMALMLARSMVRADGFVLKRVGEAYAVWYRTDPFGMRTTTRAALEGRPDASSVSNGALMRVSPIGVACRPEEAWESGFADAGLTHPNRVCREASGLFAAAVSYAIRSGAEAAAVFEWTERQVARRGVDEVLAEALRGARKAPAAGEGGVLASFRNAFWQLLHARSVESGVVDSVMRGGDTDTNAAIAGAMLGAVYGLRRMPRQWTDRVVTSRAIAGLPGVARPRPPECWPIDVLYVAERLLVLG